MNFRPFLLVLPLLLLQTAVFPGTGAQDILYAKALVTELFTTRNYTTKLRPVDDLSTVTEVRVSFYLKSIIDLDEVSERLTTSGYLIFLWPDAKLVWDAATWGGIEQLIIPQSDVWRPDVVLLNSIMDYKAIGDPNIRVRILADGSVYWYPIQVFETACSIDIKNFPYDEQECILKFGAWSYNTEEITMEGGDQGINLEKYQPNPTWDVIGSSWSADIEGSEASVSFKLKLKRKPLFIIFSTVVPIIMLSFLNVLVFTIPSDSGEKSGYAVTVFLALAVFLTIISSTLPENSDSVSLFSLYVTAQILQSTLITTVTLVEIRLSSVEKNGLIPTWLVKLTRSVKRCRCCRKTRVSSAANAKAQRNDGVEESNVGKFHPRKGKVDILQDAFSVSSEQSAGDDDDDEEVTWKEALSVLDFICTVIFSIMFIASTSTCLLLAQY